VPTKQASAAKAVAVVDPEPEAEVEAVAAEPKPARGPTGFIRVAHPMLAPNGCVICRSATGPLVDTTRELLANFGPQGFRIYLCSQCLKLAALELGLIEGDRMEELTNADQLLEQAQRDIAGRDAQIEAQFVELAAQKQRADAFETLLEQERAVVKTQARLFETISEQVAQGIPAGG
jgi:hypothetical protein